MSESFVWDTYASRVQEELSRVDIGSTTPSHLTRVLHIPHHDGSTSHHSLHDISAQYKETVGHRVMGTASYVVALGKIPKPQVIGDGVATGFETPLLYDVHFKEAGESDAASVNSISVVPSSSSKSAKVLMEVDVTIETAGDKAAVITMKRRKESEFPAEEPTMMSMSYPVAPLTWMKTVYKHPYFAFQPPGEDKAYFEWQMHPVPHGRLRYTLVRVPRGQSADSPGKPGIPSDHAILAIYHHIGNGVSLPLPYSEGVLLLSADMNPVTEAIVVASVYGMLGQLRRLSSAEKGGVGSKKSKNGGVGFIKGLLGRK